MPAIGTNNLVVVRGGRTVLRRITCEIESGIITGLLGPSGCGKTTFMRCIVGVQQIASGSVRVLGEEAGSPSLRARVGYVTQQPAIYSDFSVNENARYFAALYGLNSANARNAIVNVGLTEHADDLVGNLSGGQRTRASLACALLSDPEVLILDEPTVGLDPVLRRDLWQQFRELARGGTTLLVSSHVMDEAGRCDRLLLMRDGIFLADDTPRKLSDKIGTSNLEDVFLSIIARHDRGDV